MYNNHPPQQSDRVHNMSKVKCTQLELPLASSYVGVVTMYTQILQMQSSVSIINLKVKEGGRILNTLTYQAW